MTRNELKKLIGECVAELKLEKAIRGIVKESLKPVKVEKEHSLEAKMQELADVVKGVNKEAKVSLDDAKRYNVCDCKPHHFNIQPITDDNFTVTHFKNNTDRTKKLNLTFEDLKKFVVDTLKEKKADFGQQKWNKCVTNSEDKEGKKDLDKPQETNEKTDDAVEKKDDFPTAPMKSVEKIKKQSDHSVKGEKVNYKYPKQKDKKLVVKPSIYKGRSK